MLRENSLAGSSSSLLRREKEEDVRSRDAEICSVALPTSEQIGTVVTTPFGYKDSPRNSYLPLNAT